MSASSSLPPANSPSTVPFQSTSIPPFAPPTTDIFTPSRPTVSPVLDPRTGWYDSPSIVNFSNLPKPVTTTLSSASTLNNTSSIPFSGSLRPVVAPVPYAPVQTGVRFSEPVVTPTLETPPHLHASKLYSAAGSAQPSLSSYSTSLPTSGPPVAVPQRSPAPAANKVAPVSPSDDPLDLMAESLKRMDVILETLKVHSGAFAEQSVFSAQLHNGMQRLVRESDRNYEVSRKVLAATNANFEDLRDGLDRVFTLLVPPPSASPPMRSKGKAPEPHATADGGVGEPRAGNHSPRHPRQSLAPSSDPARTHVARAGEGDDGDGGSSSSSSHSGSDLSGHDDPPEARSGSAPRSSRDPPAPRDPSSFSVTPRQNFRSQLADPDSLGLREIMGLLPKDSEWPKFDGTMWKFLPFMQRMESLISIQGIPDEILRFKMPFCFTDSAQEWYIDMASRRYCPSTWGEWRDALNEQFKDEVWLRTMRDSLYNMRYSGTGNPSDWIHKFVQLFEGVHPACPPSQMQQAVFLQIDPMMGMFLRTECRIPAGGEVQTHDFIKKFINCAKILYPLRPRFSSTPNQPRAPAPVSHLAPKPPFVSAPPPQGAARPVFNEGPNPLNPPRFPPSQRPRPSGPPVRPSSEMRCFVCNQTGHKASAHGANGRVQVLEDSNGLEDLEELPEGLENQEEIEDQHEDYEAELDLATHDSLANGIMVLCGSEVSPDDTAQVVVSDLSVSSLASLPQAMPNAISTHTTEIVPRYQCRPDRGKIYQSSRPLFTSGFIKEKLVTVCLDTGAGPTCIEESFLAKLDPDYESKLIPMAPGTFRFTAFGHELMAQGIFETPVVFPHQEGNLRILAEFVVLPAGTCPASVIIGMDHLTLYGFEIRFGNNPYFAINNSRQHFTILRGLKFDPMKIADQPPARAPRVMTPPRILAAVAPSPAPEVGQLPDMPKGALTKELEAFEEVLAKMHINPDLTPEQNAQLLEVLRDYPMAFAHGSHQLGEVPDFECRIDLVDGADPKDLKQTAYPMHPRAEHAMREAIENLLKLGVIEPSTSPYAAPAIMVFKDDKERKVVNYRRLNAKTIADGYGIPRQERTLFGVQGAVFLCCLDANKGFYQLFVYGPHRERTAFITPWGLFQYRRVPQGLKNAPPTFQRAMDSHFWYGIRQKWLRIFIDDLLLQATSFADMLYRLRYVLYTAQAKGWTFSPTKCFFGWSSVRQLGHRISGVLLSIDENKIAAIRDLRVPENRKELQAVIGLFGYFRKFVKDFGIIARPMTELLKREVVWNWDDKCMNAFLAIKKVLLSAPVLAQPDYSKPFLIYVDACADGFGAVLQQVHEVDGKKVEVVIAFISRGLTKGEGAYGATQLECCGLVWCLEKLHCFIDMCEFTVVTDCSAVAALMNLKTPNRHMLRWQLALQEHWGRMKIIHRAGVAHANADGLSRMPLPNDESNPASDLTGDSAPYIHPLEWAGFTDATESVVSALSFVALPDQFYERLQASYSEDINFKAIYVALAEPDVPREDLLTKVDTKLRNDFNRGRFFLLDKLLYRREGVASALVVLDKKIRTSIIASCHDEVTSGHVGFDKTWEKVKAMAWWPGSNADVQLYCDTCEPCQRAKRRTGKPYGKMLEITEPSGPGEIINMDFASGFPSGGPENFNAVLIIGDRFTRKAKFAPTYTTADAAHTARVFFKYWIAENGFPRAIISDRDPLFTALFWKTLMGLAGTTQQMTAAYRANADGLAEAFVNVMKIMVKSFVAFGPTWEDPTGVKHDWPELLPGLEFAYNSSKSSTTGRTPFELDKGRIPRTLTNLFTDKLPATQIDQRAKSFAEMWLAVRRRAMEAIHDSHEYSRKRWDQSHAEIDFKVGDRVLLTTKNMDFESPSGVNHNWVGPFTVLERVDTNSYRLALTGDFVGRHPIFPVIFLKKWNEGDPEKFPGRRQPPPPKPEIVGGELHYVVEEIVNERMVKRGAQKILYYEVKWKGWPSSENTWEPAEELLENAKEAVRKYRVKLGKVKAVRDRRTTTP